jgi:hypothetical protein
MEKSMRYWMRLTALACGVFITIDSRAAGQPSTVHVLRISSGPAGVERDGSFVLSSERSTFNRNDDREVIVLFEWDGAPGAHRLVAQWRSPDAAVTSISAVDYVARAARFGAFWRLPLLPTMSLGTWSVEATVDNVPAGRMTFEVTDDKMAAAPVRPALTQAQLYERINAAAVELLRTSNAGRQIRPTFGFVAAPGRIYTTMATLDNADDIRVVTRDGVKPVTGAIAWNRQQRWAVLAGPVDAAAVPVAPLAATTVGTRCFSVESAEGASRVLSECSINGQNGQGTSVSLSAMFALGGAAPGAPVLNEYGELIGLVGDGGRTGEHQLTYRGATIGTPIVPIQMIRIDSAAPPVALADLRSRGVTTPPVASSDHVMTAGIGRVDGKGKLQATEHHGELSLRETGFAVYVMWLPKERLRGQMLVRVFDSENRLVAQSKPEKIDIRKGQSLTSAWTLPMVGSPGTYRADVLVDGTAVWRGFVAITS